MRTPSTESRWPIWMQTLAAAVGLCLLLGPLPVGAGASAGVAPADARVIEGPQFEQNDRPGGYMLDAQFYEIHSSAVLMAGAISLAIGRGALTGPVVAIGMGLVLWYQSALWNMAMMVDEARMKAWVTENLLELDFLFRTSIYYPLPLKRKFEQDLEALRERLRGYDRAGVGLTAARAMDEATVELIKKRLDTFDRAAADLDASARGLLTAFDDFRRGIVVRGVVPLSIKTPTRGDPNATRPGAGLTMGAAQEAWAVAKKLVTYIGDVMTFEQNMLAPERMLMTIDGQNQQRLVVPSSRTQLKMTVSNDSQDMVFFIKTPFPKELEPRDDDQAANRTRIGNSDPRDTTRPLTPSQVRRGWIALYPRGAAARVNDDLKLGAPPTPAATGAVGATAGSTAPTSSIAVQLPSEIWFPIQGGEKIEVRAATYGPHRQKVRWLAVKATGMQPEVQSMRRTFYYLGYEQRYLSLLQQTWTRHYSIREQYQWSFTGAWGPQPTYVKTTVADLYSPLSLVTNASPPVTMIDPKTRRPETLELVGNTDHWEWTMPELTEAMKRFEANATLKADVVDGRAEFIRRTPTLVDRIPERGSGPLHLVVEPW